MEDPIGADYEHKGLKLMDGKEREELLNNLEFSSIWECCGHEVFDKQTVKIVHSNLPFFSQIPKSSVFKKNFNRSVCHNYKKNQYFLTINTFRNKKLLMHLITNTKIP